MFPFPALECKRAAKNFPLLGLTLSEGARVSDAILVERLSVTDPEETFKKPKCSFFYLPQEGAELTIYRPLIFVQHVLKGKATKSAVVYLPKGGINGE